MPQGSLPVLARRAIVALADHLKKDPTLMSVNELSKHVGDRAKAATAMRMLEQRGLVDREGEHRWDRARWSGEIMHLARMYRDNPNKWLPAPRPHGRRPQKGNHTRYPKLVKEPSDAPLQPGRNVTKLGSRVTKGRWKGAQMFALTLEERATCSTTCAVYEVCYGNNMNMAVRWKHGADLEAKLAEQLKRMDRDGRRKDLVVIRLHVLGDFYDPEYVQFWDTMLNAYPWLRLFGYTAWPKESPIAKAVQKLNREWSGRVAIRTSGYGSKMASYVRSHDQPIPENAFQCPEQIDRTDTCATCGACWSTLKNVVFLEH